MQHSSNKILVMSAAQLLDVSIWRSVGEFAKIHTQNSKFGGLGVISHLLSTAYVCLHYVRDQLGFGNESGMINKYKAGIITSQAFCSYMQSMFGGTEQQVKAAWNSVVKPGNSKHLSDLESFVRDGGQVVLTSVTNEWNAERVREIINLTAVKFAFSFESKMELSERVNHTKLAESALADTKIENEKIIVLHSGIKISNAAFSGRFNPAQDDLSKAIKNAAESISR